MAVENSMNIKVLVGAIHRAHLGRKFMPTFQTALSDGLNHYESFYDDVIADLDRASYERQAMGRGGSRE